MRKSWAKCMSYPPLEHNNARAAFDADSRLVVVTYSGELDAATTTAVYEWLAGLAESQGIESLRGEIFDFRQVTEFMPDNLMAARKNSRRLNLRHDVQNLPVAMIVKDFIQEEILRGPMQNVKENVRKRIVRSMDDALAFIDSWHAG